MKNTADQTSSSSNSQKTSHETPLTVEEGLRLLGLREKPDWMDGDTCIHMTNGLEYLLSRYGKDWVEKNRKRLVLELKVVAEN